jgi:hypothetical protein
METISGSPWTSENHVKPIFSIAKVAVRHWQSFYDVPVFLLGPFALSSF